MTTVPLATVRNQLSAVVDDVARTHDTVTITRNGVPAVVVVSVDDYESVMETLALVTNPEDRARIDEAEQSVAEGDVASGDEMSSIVADRLDQTIE